MSQPPLLWETVNPFWPVRLACGHWAGFWTGNVMRKKRADGTYTYAFTGNYWED